MGCGSSTATSTAVQPAPTLKSTRSRSSIKETNVHTNRLKDIVEQSGEESSIKQEHGKESPPPEANGHVPHSQIETPNINVVSETTSDNSDPVEETSNQSVTEEKTMPENKERSVKEQFNGEGESPMAKRSTSQGKATADEEPVVVVASGSSVRDEGVAVVTSGGDEKPETTQENSDIESQDASVLGKDGGVGTAEVDSVHHRVASNTRLSGEQNTVANSDTSEIRKDTSPRKDTNEVSLSGEKETTSHRSTSKGSLSECRSTSKTSLSGEKDRVPENNTNTVPVSHGDTGTTPGQDQTIRKASMTLSEYFSEPSDDELHLRRQSVGSSQQNVLPSTAGAAPSSKSKNIVEEESPLLGGKEVPAEQNVDVSDDVQPVQTRRDSSLSNDSNQGKICTVTASVRIGSLEHALGQRTVTLTGSVYRIRKEGGPTTPKPGDKIGIVKGDVTTTPVGNESSKKLATLRGDLFAVSGDAEANGHIATASIDVLSYTLGDKIATITADVAPSDDPEHQSGIISGEVLAASETGSYDDKIGSLSGKVIALTF